MTKPYQFTMKGSQESRRCSTEEAVKTEQHGWQASALTHPEHNTTEYHSIKAPPYTKKVCFMVPVSGESPRC